MPEADNGLKILVLDDDKVFSRALCRLLSKSGYTALRALDSARVVPVARTDRPDAVLLGARLGKDLDGLGVCRSLRREPTTKALPILLMAGFSSAPGESRLAAAKLGISEYLFKPFSGDEVARALERALSSKMVGTPGKIMIVDDDPSWPEILTHWLTGHETRVVADPAGVFREAEGFQPDCILLDYLVDGRPTADLCARLRQDSRFDRVQVVVHSGHAEAKIQMLDAGADHFVVKTGAPEELLAVVRACLRRAQRSVPPRSAAGVQLDFTTLSVFCRGAGAKLTPRLFNVLRILVESRGVVSRQHILDHLPDAAEERDHEVDVLVHRLRAILRKHFGPSPSIETVYGEGYLWVPPSNPRPSK